MKSSKHIVMAAVLGACGLVLSSCGGKSVQEPERKEEAQLRNGLVVVNVLDKQMFDDCHIKGSINIPVEEIAQCESCVDKDADVVLYCSNYLCSSSEYAARKLREAGFKNVAVYAGGTAEWFQKGLPVEGPHQSAYLTNTIEAVGNTQEDGVVLVTVNELAHKMGIADTVNTQVVQTSEVQSPEEFK